MEVEKDKRREELELTKANAKSRCTEAWKVLQSVGKITKTYQKIHDHWRIRFEEADRELAEMDKLTVIPLKKVKPIKIVYSKQMSRDELLDLIKELETEDN